MRLDAADQAEIVRSWQQGAETAALAGEYGVSQRTIQRLLQGIEKPPPQLEVTLGETVADAVEELLARLGEPDPMRVASARALAARLDRASPREALALSSALVALVDQLRQTGRQPDALDKLQARRQARQLALAGRDT